MMKTPTSPFYAANTLNHLPIPYSPPPPPPPPPLHIASNIIPSTHSHHICIVTTHPHPPTHPPGLQRLLSSLSHLHDHLLHGGHWHSKTGDTKLCLATAWRLGERNILTCKQTPVDDHELPQKCTVHNMDRSMLTCTIIYTVPHGRKFGREFNSAAWRIMNAPPN